ncbi:MAG: AraC family transcriptional regulator [Bauldia sp.]|nr:AraC family transcriptional regulator [Bauldia sp.]
MLDHSSETVATDFLSEVLQDVRLTRVSSGHGQLTPPWGMRFAPHEGAQFHLIAAGSCWLQSPDGGWQELRPGDALLLPRAAGHVIASERGGASRPFDEIPREPAGDTTFRLRDQAGEHRTAVFCCSVAFDDSGIQPLIDLMPPLILLRDAAESDRTLPMLLDAMIVEVARPRLGTATVLSRLADVVIARVIRSWAESHREDTEGWLAAIHDPRIGRALAAIHRKPGEPWSVERLADLASTSRSVFVERFTRLVGLPPARYLARLRMHVATNWLRSDTLSVSAVASRLGYESDASFSRAFKRHVGIPPAAVRRKHQTR